MSGDTFDFVQGGVITSSAQMVDNGATVGDVLTVQADKSIAAAAGGGSLPGTPRWFGPYTVTFADIPESGDRVAVVQLPIGSVVYSWAVDPDTLVTPDLDTYMGQGPEFIAADIPTLYQGSDPMPGGLGSPMHGSDNFAYDSVTNESISFGGYGRFSRAGLSQKSALLVTQTADPIQVVNASDPLNDPATMGSADIWFEIATPPFDNDAVIS